MSKYLENFKSLAEANAQGAEGLYSPHVDIINGYDVVNYVDIGDKIFNAKFDNEGKIIVELPINKPLKFTSNEGQTLKLSVYNYSIDTSLYSYHPNIEISFDENEWSVWHGETNDGESDGTHIYYKFDEISFTEHPVIYVRGNNTERFSDLSIDGNINIECTFESSNYDIIINCEGNVMSLLGEYTNVIPCDGCFNTLMLENNIICNLTIPNTVTKIRNNSFTQVNFTSIEIPDSVTTIGDGAFYNCQNLTTIVIPDSVISIGEEIFSECKSLTSATIGNSIVSIGKCAFFNCENLTSIEIPDSVTSIGEQIFQNCLNLKSVTIGNSLTSTGIGTFYDCTSLTSVTFGKSIISIGFDTFYNCQGLTSIEIPDTVTNIGVYAFGSCMGLTTIEIPDSVTSIESDAFSICSSLVSIKIPDSVTTIGDRAFEECSALTSIICYATEPPIGGDDMFKNTNECPIYVPLESIDVYKSADYWNRYTSRIQAI